MSTSRGDATASTADIANLLGGESSFVDENAPPPRYDPRSAALRTSVVDEDAHEGRVQPPAAYRVDKRAEDFAIFEDS